MGLRINSSEVRDTSSRHSFFPERKDNAMTPKRILGIVSILVLAIVSALPLSATYAQETETSISVELQEYKDSGISGTAILSELAAGGIHVSMVLVGAELDGQHPTHIHTGTCSNFDPNPLYPLETVNLSPVNKEGISESDVADADLKTLREGEYVILVHQAHDDLTNYLVCGEISKGVVVDPRTAQKFPVSGVGFGLEETSTDMTLVAAFGALALVSVLGAGIVRRYSR
jgi:hypothetical protein